MTTNYQYSIAVDEDGSIKIDTKVPEGVEVKKEAGIFDIIDSSRKCVADLERSLLMEGITQAVNALMPTPEPTVADKVSNALKERTATPDTE
jgi:hypothetical protein